MKTKKSGVRGSVITSADLENGIAALKGCGCLDGILSDKGSLCGCRFQNPFLGDNFLTVALEPFDKIACCCNVRFSECEFDRFAEEWIEFLTKFAGEDEFNRLKASFDLMLCDIYFSIFHESKNKCRAAPFVGDYGCFRVALFECIASEYCKRNGANKKSFYLRVLENEKQIRSVDDKLMAVKGEVSEDEICKKQEQYAIDDYRSGESLNDTLIRMLKARDINGFKIVGDAGWIGLLVEEGCISRDEQGVIKVAPEGMRGQQWTRLYQRVHRALVNDGKWKMKSHRKKAKRA